MTIGTDLMVVLKQKHNLIKPAHNLDQTKRRVSKNHRPTKANEAAAAAAVAIIKTIKMTLMRSMLRLPNRRNPPTKRKVLKMTHGIC